MIGNEARIAAAPNSINQVHPRKLRNRIEILQK